MSEIQSLPNNEIRWKQVWSLISLDIAIVISWLAYHKYQPELLKQFQFTQFTLALAVVQMIVLALTPPIAGFLADKIRNKNGDRLPMINIGINVVSMVFMVVAVTIFANPIGIIRYFFPLMIVLWLISMNIFHSPAISTVELFVPPHKLPQIMAIFAFIADLTQAIEPSIIDIMEKFGAPIIFAVGGSLVFVTGYWLQQTTKNMQVINASEIPTIKEKPSNFGIVFALGLGMGVGSAVFFEAFPNIIDQYNMGIKGSYLTSILIASGAVLSLIVANFVEKFGLVRSVFVSFAFILVLILFIFFVKIPFLAMISFYIYPLAFAFLSVSALPLVIHNLNAKDKVLGIGLFFSGVEIVNGIFEIAQAMK